MNGAPAPRRHILTVELEDYYEVGALRRVVTPGHWHRFESRVERNTMATLDLLDEAGAKATFFVLGWIADNLPEVVAMVARRGHELASRGYFSRSIRQMSEAGFRDDAVRSREAIERATGAAVLGYRTPHGWLSLNDLWALDVLAEEGFAYDSSLRLLGRIPGRDRFRRFVHAHQHGDRSFWELPLSTAEIAGWMVPISGGNYMRQLPPGLIRRAIERWDRTHAAPLVFYFHVWDLDPAQPRITAAPLWERVRQYRNLAGMRDRLRFYLHRYRFTTIADHLRLVPVARPAPCAPRVIVSDPMASPPVAAPIPAGAAPALPLTLLVPCFNEEATLPYLANTLKRFAERTRGRFALSYVFVDDGSRDRTWDRLQELFGGRPDCVVVRHGTNRGIAAATVTGIDRSQTEIVATIDCDCTYDPQQLTDMVPMLTEGVDLVVASPYHRLGRVVNVPGWRLTLSKGLSRLYRRVLTQQLATYTSCFRVYRRSAMAGIVPRHGGFLGICEILGELDRRGARIVECPAVLEVRLLGHSKMKIFRTILGHLGLLARFWAERHGRGPLSNPQEERP